MPQSVGRVIVYFLTIIAVYTQASLTPRWEKVDTLSVTLTKLKGTPSGKFSNGFLVRTRKNSSCKVGARRGI